MQWLSRSDAILLLVAGYVAIMTLVRLMRSRRDRLVHDVQQQLEQRRRQGLRTQASSENRAA